MNIRKGNMNIELFNLEEDIQEQHDVASKYPDIVEKIRQIMKAEHTTPQVASFKMAALENDSE
jgi:arylsulfatase